MPRPLSEQTVVITGASSGFGRRAAVLMGGRGANVVLAARDESALKEAAAEVERAGGDTLVVVTDVAEWPQVERLAKEAVDRFGRIDTWVNNAGIGIGGLIEEVSVEELERLLRVNVMGQVHGVKAALPIMKRQGSGAFINVGSVAGVRTFPLQTMYCATKHAVKAFTEGLRLELQREKGDYHVTYIAPAAINTPFFADARSKFGAELEPPPPVYDPEVVAESIVFATENPRRDIFIGGGGKLFDVLQRISPPLMDWMLSVGDQGIKSQMSDRPKAGAGNLFDPPARHREVRGTHAPKTNSTSYYTKIFEWHPALKPVALGLAALGVVALVRGSAGRRRGPVRRFKDAVSGGVLRLLNGISPWYV